MPASADTQLRERTQARFTRKRIFPERVLAHNTCSREHPNHAASDRLNESFDLLPNRGANLREGALAARLRVDAV